MKHAFSKILNLIKFILRLLAYLCKFVSHEMDEHCSTCNELQNVQDDLEQEFRKEE